MNVERLRETLRALQRDIETTKVDQQIQQLYNILEQIVGNPGNENVQSDFRNRLDSLNKSLASAPSRGFGQIWADAVSAIDLGNMLPEAIENQVNSIVSRSDLTPAVARDEMRRLRDEVTAGRDLISQLLKGLDGLGIESTPLPPGKAEIGILIPRTAVDNNLKEFGDEARLLDQLINAISEASTGNVDDIQIDSLSSSDLIIYVLLNPWAVKAPRAVCRR
jgi:hypothetical protein